MNINTIYGDMDESLLIQSTGYTDNEVESTFWVEYRRKEFPNESPVHRSVNMTLKQMPVFTEATSAKF